MTPEEFKAKRIKKAKAYHAVFSGPNAKVVLEDLMAQFGRTTLRKDNNGRIDPNASLAAAGCREVLLYIDEMVNIDATAE